jgi:hypothetical protein
VRHFAKDISYGSSNKSSTEQFKVLAIFSARTVEGT